MEEKLFDFTRVAIIASALLFLASCLVNGWLEILFLTISLLGLFLVFPKMKNIKSVGTKSSYAMFLFLLLARLTMAVGLEFCSNIFSLVTMALALIVVVRSVVCIQKYCRRDVDEHLDEL